MKNFADAMETIFSLSKTETHIIIVVFGVKLKFRIKKKQEQITPVMPDTPDTQVRAVCEVQDIIDKLQDLPYTFYSQINQDRLALNHFNFKKEGFFIDIGAHDGVKLSNTKTMEELGWKGICVEPNPNVYNDLARNRKCDSYNLAINDKNGRASFLIVKDIVDEMYSSLSDFHDKEHIEHAFGELDGKIEKIEVETMTFDTLMAKYPDVKTIDFISIDTEGNEFKILKTIDFDKYDIKVLSVENNYDDTEMIEYMKAKGYEAFKNQFDDLYIKIIR